MHNCFSIFSLMICGSLVGSLFPGRGPMWPLNKIERHGCITRAFRRGWESLVFKRSGITFCERMAFFAYYCVFLLKSLDQSECIIGQQVLGLFIEIHIRVSIYHLSSLSCLLSFGSTPVDASCQFTADTHGLCFFRWARCQAVQQHLVLADLPCLWFRTISLMQERDVADVAISCHCHCTCMYVRAAGPFACMSGGVMTSIPSSHRMRK